MAFKTFPFQEKYSKNKGTEQRNKLKKLKSVKLVNLDILRLSMRRGNSMLNQILQTESDDACSSEQSSTPISGTSSPHYMKATTSSSARKGTVPASTGRPQSGSSSSTRTNARKKNPGSKTSLVFVEECSDPAGVNIPVENKSGKMLSLRQTRKVSRSKSMRIRARYSQFSEGSLNEAGSSSDQTPEFDEGMEDKNDCDDEDSQVRKGTKQKGIVERSRSIKLTRLRSIRSSKRRQKSRLGSEMSGSQPRYMKDTSSQEARKNSAKGLTRTSSLRPLRILAKIPSLRPRRSKVKKQSEFSVDRATCSSTLKSSKMPDHIELDSEGISSYHVCPYSYCSLNAHHHHVPTMPIKEFMSVKQQMINNQKGKQLEDRSNTSGNAEIENDDLVMEEDGEDYLIQVYAKPRKKWSIEGASFEDAEALNCSVHDQSCAGDNDWKQTEIPCETSSPEARQKRLSDGQPESYQMFSTDDKTERQNRETIASNSTLELPDSGTNSEPVNERLGKFESEESGWFVSRDSEVGSENNLIDILSDNRKYSSIWHLIYQQLASSQSSMVGNPGIGGVGEQERDEDANSCQDMNDSDPRHRKSNDLGEDQDVAVDEFDQNDVIKMVHEALNAILQREEQSPDQQSVGNTSTPIDLSEEKLRESGEVVGEGTLLEKKAMHQLEQSAASEQKSKTNEEMMPGRKASKSISKFRKIIATTKFIKAMERMRKISPRKPRFLSSESTTEEERVYLRHLSMKGRKNNEEWLLDYALRKVISRFSPEEQKRVALLVEAFETVNPEHKEKGVKFKSYPVKEQSAPRTESTNHYPLSDEHVLIQMHDGDDSVPLLCVSDEKSSSGASATGRNATGERDSRACDGINGSNSIDAAFEESNMGKEETMATLEVQPQLRSQDPEVSISGDMNTFLLDERKYQSMWSLIYQQVRLGETSIDTEKGVNECNERKQSGQEMKDLDSTHNSTSTHHDDDGDDDNQSTAGEKPELNQSAAIKLVREAIDGILQRYEQSSEQQFRSYKDSGIGDHTVEDGDGVSKHTCLQSNPELHQMEKPNEELQRQVEPDESKTPQKKFSDSYRKLKKAIVTAKFIKAMERMRKITPQKPRHLNQEAVSGEERVYLRHLSMYGKKNEEEWMLDYALRQVISKLAPDQQRRVERLVEAFDTVTPEQKDRSIRFYPSKGELAPGNGLASPIKQPPSQLVAKPRGQSIPNEVTEKQDRVLESHIGTNRIQHDDKDFQERAADDTIEQTDKAAVSHSTLELSEDHPMSAYVGEAVKEAKTEHEIDMSKVITSQTEQDSESGTAGVMITILSNKGKYNSMWQLIYQHVTLNEALVSGEDVVSGVDENEDDDAKKWQNTDGPESHQSSYGGNQMEDKSNQSEACDKKELDQSAAIKLVKEAISAILQSDEQISNRQSSASTEKDCRLEKRLEMDITSENENEICTIQKARVVPLEKVQSIEVKTSKQNIPKSASKLKKLITTTKFIKAMERLRTSPRNWSPETTSEGERVKLRPQTTNQKRSAEEWMLDYALRKVISSLAPDQQKKVAILIGAFEVVAPEQKGNITNHIEFPPVPGAGITSDQQIVELEHKDSTSSKALVPSKHEDQLNQPGKTLLKERGLNEDYPNEIWNSKMEIHENAFDSEVIPKVERQEETEHSYPSEVSKEESDTNAADGLLSGTKRHNTMWHLIYQHLGSGTVSETEDKQGERVANEDHMVPGGTSSESIVDADNDDNDASSVASELTESDTVKLLKEAIINILDKPQEDRRGENSVGEEPEKSLTRAYSKLRKLIVCNKFISAMKKRRKSHPQKHKILELDSDGAAEKAHLKPSTLSEKKNSDAWMLDHALQKAIAELKPVQQRRVAMLVKAFENVNPELEGMNRTKSADSDVSASNVEEKEDLTAELSHKSGEMKGGCDLKLEITEERIPSSSDEYLMVRQECRNDDPCRRKFASSDVTKAVSDGCEDIEETPHLDTEVVAKPSQPEYVKDVWRGGTETSISSDKERYSSLWGLLVKHINSDASENSENEKSLEIDVNSDTDKSNMLLPENDDNPQLSDEDNKGDDMEAQTPKSMSFEFQEQEAIKLVQEALHDILLPENPGGDQIMQTSAVSGQEACNETVKDTSMIPQENESSAKESLPNISSKLSKVILCKRFVKAMDKMRKLKQQSPPNHVQQHHSNAERMKSKHHIISSDKKSWEEWMLDHAMQQVVGKLAPVQKKKVSLLVQAFEAVSSQPETGTIGSKTAAWSHHIKTGKEH